ncbi:hypothetical protein UlMin_026144 [Ulmus minor]
MPMSGLTSSPSRCCVWVPVSNSNLLCRQTTGCSTHLIECAMDAFFGDMANEPTEDEIQAAMNFLIRQYAGHKPSVDAIESADDKIIMHKFYERKNPKIDIKKMIREVNQSCVVQAVRNRFQTPTT